MRILVVDSNHETTESITLALTLFGHKVYVFSNYEDGLREYEYGTYDLVILNLAYVVMGDGSYSELYAKARKTIRPVILLVEEREIRKKVRLKRHGIGSVLDVPVCLGEILEVIEEISDRTQKMPVLLG